MKRFLRPIAFALLALVTAYYFYEFVTGDWRAALGVWRGQGAILALALALNIGGVFCDLLCWLWAYRRFGLGLRHRLGAAVYLTIYAGQFIPMQLGFLIRPDAVQRLRLGGLGAGIQAEAVMFYLDVTALSALLAAVIAAFLIPWSAPLALAGVVLSSLTVAHLAADRLAHTRLALPRAFWWQGATFGMIFLRMIDWLSLGVVLYLLLRDLPGAITLHRSILFALASQFVGAGTGLPAGIGATEGLLGYFLSLLQLPEVHLVIVVGLYRGITFWLLVPFGWLALMYVNRRARALGEAPIHYRDVEEQAVLK